MGALMDMITAKLGGYAGQGSQQWIVEGRAPMPGMPLVTQRYLCGPFFSREEAAETAAKYGGDLLYLHPPPIDDEDDEDDEERGDAAC